MDVAILDEAIELIEKANANLEPQLLSRSHAKRALSAYARAHKLVSFGLAALAHRIDDVDDVAQATGASIGKARTTVETGRIMSTSDDLSEALQHGDISFDQATEIAKAEESQPGASKELVAVAQTQVFHVLREKARKIKLEAEQHRDLGQRQKEARSGRSYNDELGMTHIHLTLEPHVGTPMVARAEAEAARLAKTAKKNGGSEPFERHLADAYANMMKGSGKGPARRPELVVLVSHQVAKRGWTDVRDGEVCKIPGVGPISPEVAREIAADAFLNGVVYDGKDLREFKRWSRHIPIEVAIALELGPAPDFDGVVCVDCGNRFRTELDHVDPRAAGGPTSTKNLKARCWNCHQAKTERDRVSGKLSPPDL